MRDHSIDLSLTMTQIAGLYKFVSQSNFDVYLKNIGLGMIQAKVLASSRPDVVIVMNGDNLSITYVSSIKTIEAKFTLDQESNSDIIGVERPSIYKVTLEGDFLVANHASDPNLNVVMKFDDNGLVMTYGNENALTTRTFQRA